jgi:hypothetical protein
LWGRIRRLEQITSGLNVEIVRLAMGAEPLLNPEVRVGPRGFRAEPTDSTMRPIRPHQRAAGVA